MPRYVLTFSLLVAALALFPGLGCEDRGTGVPLMSYDTDDPYAHWGINTLADHSYDKDLALQLRNADEMWLGSLYTPRVSMSPAYGGEDRITPLLILLPPQDGDKFHFFKAGLFELVQEMIASGEIQPMHIYCPANALAFGGFFYGNSMPAGRTDSILGDRMMSWLQTNYPNIDPRASKHGIGGFGMGAYGAFRATFKHPGTFSSISVTDGPLDFDGPGNHTGLMELFDDAMSEQQSLTDYNTLTAVLTEIGTLIDTTLDTIDDTTIDTTVDTITLIDTSYAPLDTFTYKKFDSGDAYISLPLSRLFIGGALAFSPHDTLVNWDYNEYQDYVIYSKLTIDDTSTLITDVVHREYGEPGDDEFDFDFHLPFCDTAGTGWPHFQPDPTIWPLWMRNNLDSLHESASVFRPLTGVDIWIGTNPDAKWNYHEMTESWIKTLTEDFNYDVEVYHYGSFNGKPVTDDEYLYDLLRQILIFHSKSFEN